MQFPISLAICLLLPTAEAATAKPRTAELVRVEKIWDQGPHNAFTDLVRFGDQFFCVFREGQGHVSPDGAIRVVRSADGRKWESAALLRAAGKDLRDAKLSVTPQGKLMLCGGASVREGTQPATSHRSFVCFSADGANWGELQWVAGENEWLWRVTWHEGRAYGVAYAVSPQSRAQKTYGTRLYQSADGVDFRPLVDDLYRESGPTEATLRFAADGTCFCLQRRDGRPTNTALLGVSRPPYQQWQWKDLGLYFGGPDLIAAPGGGWLACGRIIEKGVAKTVLCDLDVAAGRLAPLLALPSGGDTSYPGLLWHDGQLWLSYYSSHERKTAIYLAVVRVR